MQIYMVYFPFGYFCVISLILLSYLEFRLNSKFCSCTATDFKVKIDIIQLYLFAFLQTSKFSEKVFTLNSS